MRRTRRARHRIAAALGLALLVPGGASAADELRSPQDLDGWYATLGPLGAATRVGDGWVSAIGGELSVARLREDAVPALLGLAAGGLSYGSRPGGRLWLEAEVALERPLPFALGLGLGATAEIDRNRPPRFGVQATLWAFALAIPYLRAGVMEITGAYIELGLMFKVPLRFAY
jgi:hypothetical protein